MMLMTRESQKSAYVCHGDGLMLEKLEQVQSEPKNIGQNGLWPSSCQRAQSGSKLTLNDFR